jgi:hypothetical protein
MMSKFSILENEKVGMISEKKMRDFQHSK